MAFEDELGSSLDYLDKMRTVMESESKKSADKDTKITELEAENKRLTAEVASKEAEHEKTRGELVTKGKAFDHLRSAVLDAAKAVTGPATTTTPVKS